MVENEAVFEANKPVNSTHSQIRCEIALQVSTFPTKHHICGELYSVECLFQSVGITVGCSVNAESVCEYTV